MGELLSTLKDLTNSALARHSLEPHVANELEFREDWYYSKAVFDSSNTHNRSG